MAACGSRTSALEQEAFDPDGNPYDDPSGGSTSGGSSGKPQAGSGTTPTAGNSTAGSASTDAVTTTCQSYCSVYAVKCLPRLEGRDCMSACIGEMTGFGPQCQKLGLNALKCLTPVFKKPELGCEVAVNQALTKCSKQVDKFDDCKGGGNPTPDPPDPPEPQPEPTPTPNPTVCGGMSTATFDYCYTAYSCPEGIYSTNCSLIPGNAAYNCSCSYPNGLAQGFTVGGMAPPCAYAAEVCFNPAILK